MLTDPVEIAQRQLFQYCNSFSRSLRNNLENCMLEYDHIPPEAKLNIIQLVVMKMWRSYLNVNYKDPSQAAEEYSKIENNFEKMKNDIFKEFNPSPKKEHP